MRKEKNLIENKGLINTFKKLKVRTNFNKSKLKKISFYFFKFNKLIFFKFFFKNKKKLKVIFFKKYNIIKKKDKFGFVFITTLFKKTLMFIN